MGSAVDDGGAGGWVDVALEVDALVVITGGPLGVGGIEERVTGHDGVVGCQGGVVVYDGHLVVVGVDVRRIVELSERDVQVLGVADEGDGGVGGIARQHAYQLVLDGVHAIGLGGLGHGGSGVAIGGLVAHHLEGVPQGVEGSGVAYNRSGGSGGGGGFVVEGDGE